MIAAGLNDIPWPENLRQLLNFCLGFVNLDIRMTLDLGCVVSFSSHDRFFACTYGPLVLALLVYAAIRFSGRREATSASMHMTVVLLFLMCVGPHDSRQAVPYCFEWWAFARSVVCCAHWLSVSFAVTQVSASAR